MWRLIVVCIYLVLLSQALLFAIRTAYEIRLHAINDYGRVIHEFDPYFNYRATEYLWAHGWTKFRTWFDYMSWYPLGRPVGTTIYPGLQVTSVWIKQFILPGWSINDICVFVPAWFGVLATLATAWLAYECSVGLFARNTVPGSAAQPFTSVISDIPILGWVYRKYLQPIIVDTIFGKYVMTYTGGSTLGLLYSEGSSSWGSPAIEAFVASACIMCMIPAHLMRSVGGGYDNESIAMFAMCFTFAWWVRSLRGSNDTTNYVSAVGTALSYWYMVAAWGGYVFVLNLIGVHAAVLVGLGRYSTKLHRSYTIFYGLGTMLATTVPVVGWVPLKSLEQMGPLAVFLGFQLIEYCEIQKRRRNLGWKETWKLRFMVFGAAGAVAAAICALLLQQGYFGPISSRVRGLFVKHTKTGNPLVDSVAEHQPARPESYMQYLDVASKVAPFGLALVCLSGWNDGSSFLAVYAAATYYFSAKMVRLILLTAPIASILAGIVIAFFLTWTMNAVLGGNEERPSLLVIINGSVPKSDEVTVPPPSDETPKANNSSKPGKKGSKAPKPVTSSDEPTEEPQQQTVVIKSVSVLLRFARLLAAGAVVMWARPHAESFHKKCNDLAVALSHPTIIQKARTRSRQDGSSQEVMLDDYRQAYWWLRDNTPEDARVMAWWDYGYQIAGIANRTTIADGNTWNHEHIALLGRALTSSEKEGHRIARHLADYVLLWTGGGGDDLAKSPHMRRIANSVFRHLCPKDPTCRSFGMTRDGTPSRSMRSSLLYTLHSHQLVPDVKADPNRFRLVFESKYGKVRIFKVLSVSKESRAWAADPANRICDAPGSWFCRGQYPPGLNKVLQQKTDFKQLEDFNAGGEDDSEYQRRYMENLNNPEKARQAAREGARPRPKQMRDLTSDEIRQINTRWEDTPATTELWQVINAGDAAGLSEVLKRAPGAGHMRSKDGRGPMFWAHESGHRKIVDLLKRAGVSETEKDELGLTPLDISKIALN